MTWTVEAFLFYLSPIIIHLNMEFSAALAKAAQILDEERARPTVSYELVESDPQLAGGALGALLALSRVGSAQQLSYERKDRPRRVHESPDEFRFKSVNYELLLALFSQVAINDRPAFVASLLVNISNPLSARRVERVSTRFPTWSNYVSDLPLLGEFCIRVGFKREFAQAVGESPFTEGLVLLLMQLEETIALNFNLSSDDELEQLAGTLRGVRTNAYQKTYEFIRHHSAKPRVSNPRYNALLAPVATEVTAICDGIVDECRQARYWYLKGALQQNANLEVNLDKTKVEEFLRNLGFSGPLLEVLNAAEQDFRESATPFELKNSLGHLRSFLEGLHEQACKPVAAKAGVTAPKKWGKTTEMLRSTGILSLPEESLATSLYTLISDEGVHPLIAEREYARLLRNMTIEYGLMFLAKLKRVGIKLS